MTGLNANLAWKSNLWVTALPCPIAGVIHQGSGLGSVLKGDPTGLPSRDDRYPGDYSAFELKIPA
jgi:hypothetical protein